MNNQTIAKIQAERRRQTEKWGARQFERLTAERVFAILAEEVGEVAQAVLELRPPRIEERLAALEAEIVQVAAVATAWLDQCFSAAEESQA